MKKYLKILLLTLAFTGIFSVTQLAVAADVVIPSIIPEDSTTNLAAPPDASDTQYFATTFIPALVSFVIACIGVIAFVFMVIGGVQFMVAYGNEEAITKAKSSIKYGVTGTVLGLLSYSIVSIIIHLPLAGDRPTNTTPVVVDPTGDSPVKALPWYEDPLAKMANEIVSFLLLITGLLLLVAIVVSATMMVTAQGDENQLGEAKKNLIYTIIGLVIIAISYATIHGLLNLDYFN